MSISAFGTGRADNEYTESRCRNRPSWSTLFYEVWPTFPRPSYPFRRESCIWEFFRHSVKIGEDRINDLRCKTLVSTCCPPNSRSGFGNYSTSTLPQFAIVERDSHKPVDRPNGSVAQGRSCRLDCRSDCNTSARTPNRLPEPLSRH